MTNLNTLSLVNGVPSSGTGTVSTIDNLLGSGISVANTPTITASSYTAGYVIGGIMTFASILAPISNGGIINSITLLFKGSSQTTEFDVAIFNTSPGGTYTDHAAPAIIAADTALLLGIYQLTNPQSQLGTHTVYSLDGIGKYVGGQPSTSLYGVVTTKSAPTANPASTTDMTLRLGVIF